MKLNEKITACRRRAGLSQETLAELVGVSRQAVSKWECGDAVPEPAKILLLARTFGVTTDWLLDDALGDPEPEPQPCAQTLDSEPNPAPTQTQSAYPGWVDAAPGVIGRFLRRWGWLAGVYVMLIGLLITGIGGAGRLVFGMAMHNPSAPTYTASSSVIIRDEDGRDITDEMPPELIEQIMGSAPGDAWGRSPFDSGFAAAQSSFDSVASAVMIVPNLIITIGVVIMLIGAGVAIALWRVGRSGQSA